MVIKPCNSSACGRCGMEDPLLQHNVRYRGSFRHLCTTCVLRLHPQSFCPTCFQVYPPPAPAVPLTCFKCGSWTHSQCVAAPPPPSPYICPLCVNPNASIILKSGEGFMLMDRDSTKKLLAAAKIVSASLNKAAVAAKAEAERRAKEAVVTRKRAKEALEVLADLEMKEKSSKKDKGTPPPPVLGGGGFKGSGLKMTSAELRRKNSATSTAGTSGGGGEVVEWSDSDIDQMLFSDDDNAAAAAPALDF